MPRVEKAIDVEKLRNGLGMSQQDFAALLSVRVDRLKRWEKGLSKPRGPAKALIRFIHHDPAKAVEILKTIPIDIAN